jgi:uncharacterized cofD-like protein
VSGPAVVGLGGGHGLAATLSAARHYAGDITAVVSVADDGGSSGRLRRDFGMPAPGDIRRCLVALSDDPEGAWAAAFGRRFEHGDLAGHVLGNLVIAGLAETLGSFEAAIEEAARLLSVRGRVLPATVEPVVLVGEVSGQRLVGQKALEDAGGPITSVGIDPRGAPAPAGVVAAIAAADQVVIGPGSLFTSVLAVLAVDAIRDAVAARSGGVVFVCNLRPSKETIGFDVAAHVDALARHGVVPDVVLVDFAGLEPGDLRIDGPRLATATLARANGWSHDVGRLADALAALSSAE